MIKYTLYKSSGEITLSGIAKEQEDIPSIEGHTLILGLETNPSIHYIKNKEVINKPPQPNVGDVFDYNTELWVPNYNLYSEIIKSKRNLLLQQSDWTQFPNSPLSEEKKTEWGIYRQALRDITTQQGYPFNVIWPTQP